MQHPLRRTSLVSHRNGLPTEVFKEDNVPCLTDPICKSLIIGSGTRFVENDVKHNNCGTRLRQTFCEAGVQQARPLPGIIRQVETSSRGLIYADDNDIRWRLSHSPQFEQYSQADGFLELKDSGHKTE